MNDAQDETDQIFRDIFYARVIFIPGPPEWGPNLWLRLRKEAAKRLVREHRIHSEWRNGDDLYLTPETTNDPR